MKKIFLKLAINFYAVFIYAFILLPVVVLVLFSFQSSSLPVPPFNGPSLQWYKDILNDTNLTIALQNSILVAIFSSLIAVVIAFMAAFGIARYNIRGKAILRTLFIIPLSVSYLIIGMGLLITFNNIGIPKSLFAAGIGHIVINMPLAFAIIFSQMGDHQVSMEHAARDLGANEFQVITRITIPVLWPAIFAAFFLSLTFSWDEFIIAFLVTNFDVTLPVEIWSMIRSGLNPRTNAVGSFVFLVSIVIVILLDITVFRGKNKVERR